jgi:hypothetical protein
MGFDFDHGANTMSASHLILLDDYFPGISRMSRYRISRSAGFPDPVIIRNKKYYYQHELVEWAETCRRSKREREAASAAEVENA